MRSFIRAAEIWLPSPDGAELVFGDGLYGALDAFREHSRAVRFRKGEGLPGAAWAARHPIVIKSLKDSSFLRIAKASEAGLTSGIAMPIFAGDAIKAVVVLLCGDDAGHVGAIEVWKNDPEEDAQIGLHDGYYGAAELFETISRMKRFGRGFGLPGSVWAADMPIVLREIYRSERFLRQEEAQQVGLTLGLGLPCNYDPGRTWVMVFLSARGTPIARSFEIWRPDAEGRHLVYDAGLSEDEAARPARIGLGEGLLGKLLSTGVPAISEDCAADAPWLAGPDGQGGRAALAIPTLDPEGRLKAITAWCF
ncbi:GAF domain-containing protein [Methylobacterium planeticum]|uniref:GAF domain-containing protein n=1 Tax=Methylobacterium planeticum TaxID=2615211 RepID=A0A6N6MZV4_9HYPH|nr:GAF domain-containing protein [Methylobacterium planeticum]KAB1076184.1 GAF domain-containing protein [Methylobacterium planeticum]